MVPPPGGQRVDLLGRERGAVDDRVDPGVVGGRRRYLGNREVAACAYGVARGRGRNCDRIVTRIGRRCG